MEIFEALVVGLIQGIVEWLPLSSEGVTTLVMINFFGKPFGQALAIAIWLHLGTLFAAILYFRFEVKKVLTDIRDIIRKPHEYNYNDEKYVLTSFLAIVTIITVIIGGAIYLLGVSNLNISGKIATALIGVALIITGILLFISKRIKTHKSISIRDSVLLGAVQGLSIIPGISRSGITTATLLFRKYNAKQALTLSFLMSIPAIIAAIIGLIIFEGWAFGVSSLIALFFSFLTGYITIHYFVKLAEKVNFAWFALIIGLLSIISVIIL